MLAVEMCTEKLKTGRSGPKMTNCNKIEKRRGKNCTVTHFRNEWFELRNIQSLCSDCLSEGKVKRNCCCCCCYCYCCCRLTC